ncbi:2-dehydro-3-deoxygalactonokinase [Sinirhodobacter sp. WL0062]|uniref:2-dehydro-3-deoxygalactonokinase n=1 Tax=Rhodobacter flavimaris TaxID=2907145 RepID=A0ABS8YU05_9RHOB|nr:2-dehydro-3-deoxygalactonokinase [Sinirhodobacter sp. WL0062]MCE5972570.1 2-dehydro-3-deoxygalactonokinase [Sinirhodobacter sp. WL0062]
MEKPDWIAVDWGTTQLRAFVMRGNVPLASAESPDGMAQLAPDAFEPALLRLIDPWLTDATLPVIACGMVGARQGWVEAPYRSVPCAPVATGQTQVVPTRDPRIRVEIVPGLSQQTSADVMRGEETQIAGFLVQVPEFEGVLILPGTHSKHVQIAAGQVVRFATHMTGELFALLSRQSVLRHSVAGDGHVDAAFVEGVESGLTGHVLERLFSIRAEGLLAGLLPAAARARLSGMLIGAELARLPAAADYVLIGNGGLIALYARAMAVAGLNSKQHDGADLVCKGLGVVRGEMAR